VIVLVNAEVLEVFKLPSSQAKLGKGILPEAGKETWPIVPLQHALLAALSHLEMPRFCRRYPALLDALLRQLMDVVNVCRARPLEQKMWMD